MSSRFKTWRERRQLRRGLQLASTSKFQAGEIDAKKHREIYDVSNDPDKLANLHLQLTLDQSALGAPDWGAILQWIRDHWLEVLKLMFSLAILLEEEDG